MFVDVLEADFYQLARAVQTVMPAGVPLRLDELFIDALPDGGFGPPVGVWSQDRIDTSWDRGFRGADRALPGYGGFDALAALTPIEQIAGIAPI
jgi:hypothetical protein